MKSDLSNDLNKQYSLLVGKEKELKKVLKQYKEILSNLFEDVRVIGGLLNVNTSKQSLSFFTKRMHKIEDELIKIQFEKAFVMAEKTKKSNYYLEICGIQGIVEDYNKFYQNKPIKIQYESDVLEPDNKIQFIFEWE